MTTPQLPPAQTACPCANLDWSDVIAEAMRLGSPTPEHHPDCTVAAAETGESIKRGFEQMRDACTYPPSHSGTVTLQFPIDDPNLAIFLNDDEGEFNFIIGAVDTRCHWTKLSQSLTVTVSETIARFELSFRILDVLSPPAARAAWLEENRRRKDS